MATDIVPFRLGLAVAAPHRLAAPPVVAVRMALYRRYAGSLLLPVRVPARLILE